MNISSTLQSAMGAYPEWDYRTTTHNRSAVSTEYYYKLHRRIVLGLILLVCCVGFVGNGIVVSLLGFHIKKNTYTTYILNLAVADFAVLLAIALFCIARNFPTSRKIFRTTVFLVFTYNASQFLLAVIGMERCVSILFPIWHRCSRPTHLSTIVSALIWVLSFLLSSTCSIFIAFGMISFLCLPLMTVSSMILFCKICCKSQWQRVRKSLMIISLALFVFLILGYPLSGLVFYGFFIRIPVISPYYGLLCASLNSSVNPLIYYLFGRKKGADSKDSMKVILERVVDEGSRQEVDPPN